jgi:predicted RNase H-like HicB family nuclease
MKYLVVIHKDSDSDYGVTVPDLPGCFSAGTSLNDALDNVVEAINLHVQGLMRDSGFIPDRKSVDEHKANPDFADAHYWTTVDVTDTTAHPAHSE